MKKKLPFIFLIIFNFYFSQNSSDCKDFDSINIKKYNDYVKKYENENFEPLQKLILKELDCIKFDDDIRLTINSAFLTSEGPQKCSMNEKYLETSFLEQKIWNPKLLTEIRKKVKFNIFPTIRAQSNDLFFDNYLKVYASNSLNYLSREQKEYIYSKTVETADESKTLYLEGNIDQKNKNYADLNRLYYEISDSNNNIEFTLQIQTHKRSYIVKYFYNYSNKEWN